jgi:hypothetical protein
MNIEESFNRLTRKIDVFEETNSTCRKKVYVVIEQYYIPDIAKIILEYTIIISSRDAFRFIAPCISQDICSVFDLFVVAITSNDKDLFRIIGISYFYRRLNNDMKSTVKKLIDMYRVKNNWTDKESNACFHIPPPYRPPHLRRN